MRRKRGRARSDASNPDAETNGTMSTSPEDGPRRPKRSSSNAPGPSRTSRLQPTTALHMTTRNAASQAATNSTANSDASGDSRRSSLADSSAAHVAVGGFDIDAERPAKRSRLSDRSNPSTNERSSQSSTLDSNSTLRRAKKEESLAVPLLTIDGDAVNNGALSAEPSENDDATAVGDAADQENADVIRDLKPVTPVKRRGRGRRPRNANLAIESGNESIGQRTPGRSARSGSRANGDGLDTDQDRPTRIIKRLPGRRRAPNPNRSIEADLRRQLHLKMGYRAVAKALKPILAELAKRSVDELLVNEEYHRQKQEYDLVMEQLDRRLRDKLQTLEHEKRILTQFYERSRTVNSDAVRELFEEDYLITGKHALLNLTRDKDRHSDSEATDDEGSIATDNEDTIPHTKVKYGIIMPLHNSASPDRPTGLLDSRFDSRSRVFVETDRQWERSRSRWTFRAAALRATEEHPEELNALQTLVDGLGTTDYARRPQAIAKLNIRALAEAADEVEAKAKKEALEPIPKVIPNEDAEGLQALLHGMEMRANNIQIPLQEKIPLPELAPHPFPEEAPQPHHKAERPQSTPMTHHPEFQERPTQESFRPATYYDPTKSALPSREDDFRYSRERVENLPPIQATRSEAPAIYDPLRDPYSRIISLNQSRYGRDGENLQRRPDSRHSEQGGHEQQALPHAKWTIPRKQHSRSSSIEEKVSRERSTSFRRNATPDTVNEQHLPRIKAENPQTPLPAEPTNAHGSVPPAGPYTSVFAMEPIPEHQRLGPVAYPSPVSTQLAPQTAPSFPPATPAAPQGIIPPPYQTESPYRHSPDGSHWRQDYDRHEANKARLSHLRPNRPMTIEEEIAALRERHTPHHMKERRDSGEMRPRAETIAEPQQSKRPTLAVDTAAINEGRNHGPLTAPARDSPVPTDTHSAGARQMSPFPLLQRAPLSSEPGPRDSPLSQGHNPRSHSIGGIPLEPSHTPYHGYAPPQLQPAYPPYGPLPPPPTYGAPPPPGQGHYAPPGYGAPPAGAPKPLQPPFGNPPSPSTPASAAGPGAPPPPPQQIPPHAPLFQPILPNNPPSSVMTPTYSGKQYGGTPIQPANPQALGGGPVVPPFGPAFSQIGATAAAAAAAASSPVAGTPQAGEGRSNGAGRGGRGRGRGARAGETVFSHYQGPPGEKNGKS